MTIHYVDVPLDVPVASLWDNLCAILCDPERLACLCVGILACGLLVRCLKLASRHPRRS